ncbi:hypothetical protein F0562_009168 [Nyssa sinensis]|uniref:Leucine-rich repeat-containing N-terminal plant-type domain-containing protein n=1 Tax=Nyssa sinensis TaxID=561372 RepID=A0A5J4ZWD1_9ASTE|nr:hypothetical protein F0562_009168 [Nyssa sinensis]
MACADQPWSLILVIILLLHVITSSSKPDSEILLKFKYSLGKNSRLSTWNTSTSPCSGDGTNWIGILCEKGTIWGLQLENMGLTGAMDLNSLKELPFLRTLSFMHNNFEGPLPSIKELRALKSVYLTNNKFSGDIQANAFDGMLSLKKVHLAHNRFTGLIPLSLTILPRLLELRLEGNKFEGAIPDFQQDGLKVMNVSNNVLEGQIPEGLSKMDASSFSGNSDLCGPPLGLCPSSQKLSVGTIVLLVIVVAAALAAIAAVFVILRRGNPTPQLQEAPGSLHVHKEVTFTDADNMEHGSPREHSSKGRRAGVDISEG